MNYNERLSGNEAIAFAMKQIDPDVMAAFPITPSTEIPQYFAQYVANGEVNTEFVPVESEHSSMSACIGAEAAGARAVTATSSAGLALMYEMMYVAASHHPGLREPGPHRPHQHQQRPLGLHGHPGRGVDSDLRGEQPGGL